MKTKCYFISMIKGFNQVWEYHLALRYTSYKPPKHKIVQSLNRFRSNSVFRFFIWKCVKSRTIKKVLIPSREAKFIFCSWHLCHHHYNYYYHPFKIETLKWKWNLFSFLVFLLHQQKMFLFVYLPFQYRNERRQIICLY